MINATITIDQFTNLLRRVEKLEHREVNINEVREDYHEIKKTVAVTDTKFDSLEEKMDFRFDAVDARFNSLEKSVDTRLDMIWKLLVVMLGATFLMFGTLITILLRLFGVI